MNQLLLPKNRLLILLPLFSLIFTIGLWQLWLAEWKPLLNLEKIITYQKFAWRGLHNPDPDVVIIAIDDRSKELETLNLINQEDAEYKLRPIQLMMEGFPFPRELYPLLMEKLIGAGARVVAFDMLFPSPSIYGEGDDALFARGIEKFRDRVVIGSNLQLEQSKSVNGQEIGGQSGISLPIEKLQIEGSVGYVNYVPRKDEAIHDAFYTTSLEFISGAVPFVDEKTQTVFTSYDGLTCLKADPSRKPSSLGWERRMINFQGPSGTYKPIPLYEIFIPSFWERNFGNGAFFKNKVVLVGPMGNWTTDYHDTAYGRMAGVEVHAQSIATLLRNDFLHEIVNPWAVLGIMLCASALAIALVMLVQNPLLKFSLVTAEGGAYLGLSQILFVHASLMLPMAGPLVALSGTGIVALVYQFVLERIERARVKSTFDKFVSKNVANYLLQNRNEYALSLGGLRKPVTILFSDIRGFTTMTETADAQMLVQQLNEYFGSMVPLVFKTDGTLHKYIGDAIMAVWGDTHSHGPKQDAINACRTVCQMIEILPALNEGWKSSGKPELRIGVGLNHGEVIVGNIGSSERLEFTVIGDAVNLASRLEGATKTFHTDKLIGESVAALVREDFWLRSAGKITVKGKTVPVEVFILLAEKLPGKLSETEIAWYAEYEKGYAAFMSKDFATAAKIFTHCLASVPDDYLCESYLAESVKFLKNAPDPSWDGVLVMKDK
ncbi:MAG: adenylate/guanylate cyclase domain-containing protein [Verrucomicrobiae bacterium]|nr:adenylate/guanylate cyclase domain-containing protein [Verrucomicrobiae bacterium]